jgi:hypothetical protein
MNMNSTTLRASLTWILLLWAAACSDAAEPTPRHDEQRGASKPPAFVLAANVDKSAFIGTWDGERAGEYRNTRAHEVASYPYVFVRDATVIVSQNKDSDEVLRFEIERDGELTPGGTLRAPARSTPSMVVFASPDKAYVSLPSAGKVLAFDPNTMEELATIDFNGPDWAVSEEDAGDENPDPGALGVRDGKLYVGLAQLKNEYTAHRGVHLAIVDIETDTIEKVLSDERGKLAESGGEVDRIFTDEDGDLYVYGAGSYGFDPEQSHGFLRIKAGESEFDPDYELDVGAVELDVPGGRMDYLNHLIYGGNGVVYATGNVPALASDPPDYAKDHTFQAVSVDLPAGKLTLLDLPRSNGYSGAIAQVGDRLLVAVASEEAIGVFELDLETGKASKQPVVKTMGYVSAIRGI